MRRIYIIYLTFVLVSISDAQAQLVNSDYPVIGKPVPDFTLKSVQDFADDTFSPNDVKGKWLVLDFWNKTCVVCIKSFPKVNELQQKFTGKIQFLLVGANDKRYNNGIEKVYASYKKELNLNLASAFDSVLYQRFKVNGAPHIVIIDPQQKVYAITYGEEVTEEKLTALVQGKRPVFKKKPYDFEQRDVFNIPWAYEITELDSNKVDFLFKSVLSKYKGEPIRGGWIDQNLPKGFFQVTGATLAQLYNIAYFGQGTWGREGYYFTHWKYPILELNDSSAFDVDFDSYRGYYNYSAAGSKYKMTRASLMQTIKSDLLNYFGYEVTEETRMMPYWKLTATAAGKKKIIAKRKVNGGEMGMTGIHAKGIVVRNILETIETYQGNGNLPLIDETGIAELIDLDLDADMNNIVEVSEALRRLGLLLEKSIKKTKVLVITDKKATSDSTTRSRSE